MLNRNSIYKLFIILILVSTFIGYFIGSGIAAYGPIILCMFLILLLEIIQPRPMKISDWGASFIWIPYVALAGIYYVANPLDGRYLTTNLLAIISLPILAIALSRLKHNLSHEQLVLFLYKIILYFSLGQLIICIGQISTYIFGIGLPVSKEYSEYFMISGTFTNSNDLGSIILLLCFIFTAFKELSNKNKNIIWILLLTLLIISGSRSALLLGGILYLKSRGMSIRNLVISIVLCMLSYLIIFQFFSNSQLDVFSRLSQRVESLFKIFELGIQSDNSLSLRIQSYLHFLENISKLGFGSREVGNYFKYSEGVNFNTYLLFQNPHSLIIEIGYWLGIPGLIFFFAALLYFLRLSKNKLSLIIVVLVSSLIPSSLLGNLIYFALMIITFYAHSYSFKQKQIAY